MKWRLPVYKKPKRVWEWRGQNHYHEACELEKRSNHIWPGTKLYSIDQAHFQQRKKIPQLPRQQSWPESPTCYSHFSTFSRSHLFLQNNSCLCLQFLFCAIKKCLQATSNISLVRRSQKENVATHVAPKKTIALKPPRAKEARDISCFSDTFRYRGYRKM